LCLNALLEISLSYILVCTDSKLALPEAVVAPVNADTLTHMSTNCVAESTLPAMAGDETNTHTAVSSCLPAYDAEIVADVPTLDLAVPVTCSAGFISSSSCPTAVAQSYLPCGGVATADVDIVTASDCLLQAVADDDEDDMAADEQMEDWDQGVFDP